MGDENSILTEADARHLLRRTGFDVKRLYISIDHKFSDIWSANITTDISLIANTNTVATAITNGL